MNKLIRIITGIVTLMLLSGCYLNDDHFNDVMNLDSNFKQLEQKDQQMQQELDAIRAAASKKTQGDEK